MRTRTFTLVLVLLAVATAPAAEWLARVAGPEPASGVVFAAEGWSLVRADDDELAALARDGASLDALEPWSDRADYLYVLCDGESERAAARSCGRVLLEDAAGLVLATDDEGILALNRLPVELAGIGPHERSPAAGTARPVQSALPDSLIWALIGRVSEDSTRAVIQRLWDFHVRYSTTDSCRRAMDWVRSRLTGFGCDSVWLDTFRPTYAPNAVGLKRGTVNPDKYYVVCAHADATSETPQTYSPGCEDNGSGVAAVLELARVLADMRVENSLLFCVFAGEEQGLVGSDSLARRARDRGDSIRLAVNFDMISYGRENRDSIVIYGARNAPNSEAFVTFFRAQADTFSALKHYATIENTPQARSDHYSFWKYGFPTIRGGYHDRTPLYHFTGDTIGPLYYAQCGTNNVPMETEVIKALVATVAKLVGATPTVGVREARATPLAEFAGPGIVSGILRLGGTEPSVLLDAAGRRVADLAPGANDISLVRSGVYFVRGRGGEVRRVVVQR
jgi:hypothetical protein